MTMKRIRLNGTILQSERGPLLETESGDIWKLVFEVLSYPDGDGAVTVEATVGENSTLYVDWIGKRDPVPDAKP